MSKRKKVLLVDDEPDIREILAEELKFSGIEVFQASNGREAFEIFLKERPATVLSDVRMAGGDGVTLARQVKAMTHEQSRMFLLTGFSDLTPWDAYEIGVEGYFTKPFKLAEIRDVVERSFKPLSELFSAPWSGPVSGTIKLKINSLKDFLEHSEIRIGRGGIFIPLELLCERRALRGGDVYKLECGSDSLGLVAFRWARIDAGGEGSLGIGVEFVSLSKELLQKLSDRKQFETGAAYIPRGPI